MSKSAFTKTVYAVRVTNDGAGLDLLLFAREKDAQDYAQQTEQTLKLGACDHGVSVVERSVLGSLAARIAC